MKQVLVVCALVAGLFVHIGSSPAAAAGSPFTGFSVESYGSFVSALKGTAKSGPTALSVLGCTSQTGLETANSTAELDLDGIGSVGAVVTSGRTFEIAGGIADRATSAVADVRLFNGLIEVSAMTAEATAMRLGESLATEAHSSIGSVTIGGNQLDVSAEPNTTVDLTLPGAGAPFGYVVLNSQEKAQGSNGITMTARAVDVHITGDNPFGLPLESRIVIGLARASIKPEMQGRLNGGAYSTYARVGDQVASSQTAFLPHNCMGSTGGLSVASLDTPLVKTGAAKSKIVGVTNATEADAWSQNTIANASLLGGVLTVDAITATAHARYTGGSVTLDAHGTLFTGVRLNDELISLGGIKQNTTLEIPGVGSATLKKVEKVGNRIEVTMIEIEITIGTDAGTTLQVGRAAAGISR